MAKLLTADQINAQADQLEKGHADDAWRAAAAQHLRAAGNFIRLAEQQDEAARLAAEAERAAEEAAKESQGE